MPGFSDILEKRKISTPFLYGVSQRGLFPDLTHEDYVRLLVQSSAPVLQLREKDLSRAQLRPLVRRAVACRRQSRILVVNSEVELALEQAADGCHLTSHQSLSRARRLRAEAGRAGDFLLGKSVHSVRAAVRAESEGADYVILGPVFAPLSKETPIHPLGISALREAAQMLFIPVVAIGGIEEASLPILWSTGVAGAAGISWLRRELSSILAGTGKEGKISNA